MARDSGGAVITAGAGVRSNMVFTASKQNNIPKIFTNKTVIWQFGMVFCYFKHIYRTLKVYRSTEIPRTYSKRH